MPTIDELREQVRGPVIEPGDDGYDEPARSTTACSTGGPR